MYYALLVCLLLVSSQAWAGITTNFTATRTCESPYPAPCGVFFDAIGDADGSGSDEVVDTTYTNEFRDVKCEWDFGDTGAGTWPLTGLSKNYAIGSIANHLYTAPGPYTVTLTCTNEDGETDSAQTTVTIGDADDITDANTWCACYDGAGSTCVETGGSQAGFAGCPLDTDDDGDCDNETTHCIEEQDFGQIASDSGVAANQRRVLLRYGDTFTDTGPQVSLNNGGSIQGVLSAYGTRSGDNRPLIDGGDACIEIGSEWTIAHLRWDLDAGLGQDCFSHVSDRKIDKINMVDLKATDVTFHVIAMQEGGCPDIIDANSGVAHDLQTWVDIEATRAAGGNDNIMHTCNERSAFMGINLDVNDLGASYATRMQRSKKVILQHGRWYDPGDNVFQIRAISSVDSATYGPLTDQFIIISDSLLSQDSDANNFIKTCGDNACGATQDGEIQDLLVERNFITWITGGSNALFNGFEAKGCRFTLRNNIYDLQGVGGTGGHFIFRSQASDQSCAGDHSVYNNTFFTDDGHSGDFTVCAGSTGTGNACRNNLGYFPGWAGALVALDAGATGWTESNNSLSTSTNPFAAMPPEEGLTVADDFKLASGSAARDSGYDFASHSGYVFLDYFQGCRGGDTGGPDSSWDIGAHEYGSTTCAPSAGGGGSGSMIFGSGKFGSGRW